ncbi:MAG: hypothetical protein LHW57_07245 [Candidatus Cloacimonetes bacterium]|nr:hypothetical protein [Candidatus Cloacimonadota bacterium]
MGKKELSTNYTNLHELRGDGGKEWVTEKSGTRENAWEKRTVHKLHKFTRIKRGYGKEWAAEKHRKRNGVGHPGFDPGIYIFIRINGLNGLYGFLLSVISAKSV